MDETEVEIPLYTRVVDEPGRRAFKSPIIRWMKQKSKYLDEPGRRAFKSPFETEVEIPLYTRVVDDLGRRAFKCPVGTKYR
jgi:hypothetical protein